MTYKEAITYGTDKLTEAGVAEAALDAWLLLEHRTGLSRSSYFLHNMDDMPQEQWEIYKADVERRSRRIPLQHITGVQEFMGLTFRVNEHVLIPRQDTECLVEEAMQYLQSECEVLDMCTGSGCIIVSLAEEAKKNKLKNVIFTGVDLSRDALDVAEENAKNLNAEVTFLQSDLFENVKGTFDMIVSNPPYIRTDVIEGLQAEVKLHDPFIALDGKEDGLYFYRRIVNESRCYLKTKGRLLFEIGCEQGKTVSELMEMAGFSDIVVKKDLAGLDRVVIGVYNC